ncbi:MAG: sulfate transporter [Ideonella sp. MAG2]|nr:MAG: sulfate transporter [Ideonella sp. MAG2]
MNTATFTATPPLKGWSAYKQALPEDVLAALIVTVLLVPQSLAYALLAGLPPIAGVMASLLPIVAYALLGSSSTLAVGPVAVLAMLTAQAIGPVAQAHGVSASLVALVLSVEIGVVFLIAAALRLDVLAALLSAPVLHGFVNGASLAIALAQVPALLGLPIKGNTLPELWASAQAQPSLQPHAATLLMGGSALLLLWALRRWATPGLKALGLTPRAAQLWGRMAPMLVVTASIASIMLAPQAWTGVALAGAISLGDGLQFAPPWQAPLAVWQDLFTPALLLGLVAYVESLAVAESLAARRGEAISPRRELLGLGAANVAAGLSGAMPVTGGFSRSIVNFDAGARTRFAGLWTALFLGVAMATLGGYLAALPKAVLAATIFLAVLSLVDLHHFSTAWRYHRLEGGLMISVALATLFLGVEPALALGVLLSIVLLLQRTARPHWAEVGRLPGTEVFRNVRRHQVETLPHLLQVRVDESLVFTNTRWLADTLGQLVQQRTAVRHLVLMMPAVNFIDLSGLEGLQKLNDELRQRGVTLHLSELKGPVADRLKAGGLEQWLTGRVFLTEAEAWHALQAP